MGEIEELLLAQLVDGRVEGVRVALTEARASPLLLDRHDGANELPLRVSALR